MVPDKKGKRSIPISDNDSKHERDFDYPESGDGIQGEIPSALSRALGKADEVEKDSLKAQVRELSSRITEFEDELNRERAKVQNIRRRTDEELQEARKYGAYDFAFDLLNIIDCLEMGMNCSVDAAPEVLKPFIEGVDYTVQELMNVLRKNGIEEIPTDIPYDPDFHQVFECIENSGEKPGTILKVNRRGYKYRDRVLRNALVVIAGGSSECQDEDGG